MRGTYQSSIIEEVRRHPESTAPLGVETDCVQHLRCHSQKGGNPTTFQSVIESLPS
jgi:hypothetical protein